MILLLIGISVASLAVSLYVKYLHREIHDRDKKIEEYQHRLSLNSTLGKRLRALAEIIKLAGPKSEDARLFILNNRDLVGFEDLANALILVK